MEINVGKLNELPEGSYQLIDMRSDRDFEYGTIPGAKCFHLHLFIIFFF